MKNNKGFVLSTYVYMLLVFFLLLLGTMLAVLNNTKLISNKLKENSSTSSGLVNNEFNIVLLGDNEVIVRLDEEYIEPGYIAKTISGKDISKKVDVIGEVNTSQIGEYTLIYRIKHDGKVKELERKVHVKDNIAVNYINELYLTEKGKNGLLQTYGTINGEKVDAGIRYVGATPKNKVYFNCKDEYTSDSEIIKYGDKDYDYEKNCEVWRIIGVFDTKSTDSETEIPVKRVKIVRNESFTTTMSWDSSSSGVNEGELAVNSGNGINQWGDIKDSNGNTIYEGADLMRILNGYYIGKSSTCRYCNGSNQVTCGNDCSSSVKTMSSSSLNMADDVLWHLGAIAYNQTTLLTMYEAERSAQAVNCTTGNLCNDGIQRTTTWNGKIGLIYPSDYVYASKDINCPSDTYGNDSSCGESNWLKTNGSYWTISSVIYANHAQRVWLISWSNNVNYSNAAGTTGVRPSLYLSPNVKIAGGNGGSEPYKLKI